MSAHPLPISNSTQVLPAPSSSLTIQSYAGSSRLSVWLRRSVGIAITVVIFVWMGRPIVQNWGHFKSHVYEISWSRMLLASVMFGGFLYVFRAMSWRRILIGFGHPLPIAPAARIWSSSELARYLPGVVWQVIGRAYLVRPYGIPASVCSGSQVLELVIFLLANILVAITCLLWNGSKHLHGVAQAWMYCAMALVPILLFLLHPRVFYGGMNRILARIGKPPLMRQLSFRLMAMLLLWAALGLVWQSLAIWIVTAPPLGLQFTKWWVVAGAYSLAWCAGFLAVWAPGGIGVRELVFVTAMQFVLPGPVRHGFDDPGALLGFLAFLSVLLRLWAIGGELMMAGFSYACDLNGALGKPVISQEVAAVTPEKPRN